MITINFRNGEYLPAKLLYYMVYEYLDKKKLGKVDKTNNNPDFGNYGIGKILGWGFANSHTYKVYLHKIFRNAPFYPKSIIVKKSWANKNQETINKFINNERFVVKPDKGQSGKGISLVRDAKDVVGKIDDNFWILQKVIEPRLFENKKFDMRIFHFILRYKGSYYNILTKCGVVKSCVKKYTNNIDGFLTNIMHNNKLDKNVEHLFDFFDFMGKLEREEEKRKDLILKVYDVIREYSLMISKNLEVSKVSNAQIMMYGPDLIVDNNDEVYLLETNCSPGILIKGEVSYGKQRRMLEELMENVIVPILERKNLDLEGYKGNLLFIEKLS